jgi:hypothetical protein
MSWFSKKKFTTEEVVANVESIALRYQDWLMEKLDKKMPPALLAFLWAIAGSFIVAILHDSKKLTRDVSLDVRKQLAERFVLRSMGGFGSMDFEEIETAKEYFDDCWNACQSYIGHVGKQGVWSGLRSWSKETPQISQLLDDEIIGPSALIAMMSTTNDAVKIAMEEH